MNVCLFILKQNFYSHSDYTAAVQIISLLTFSVPRLRMVCLKNIPDSTTFSTKILNLFSTNFSSAELQKMICDEHVSCTFYYYLSTFPFLWMTLLKSAFIKLFPRSELPFNSLCIYLSNLVNLSSVNLHVSPYICWRLGTFFKCPRKYIPLYWLYLPCSFTWYLVVHFFPPNQS